MVFWVGLVTVGQTAMQHHVPIVIPPSQARFKHHLNEWEISEITHFDFESGDGQWISGLPGEDPHTTTRRYCSSDSCWWFGIDQFNGYNNNWRNYQDTDALQVTDGGIHLQFNHLVSIEAAFPGPGPPHPDDAWDVVNLQISVNDGPFVPIDPNFSGWTGYAYTCTSSYAYGVDWNIGHFYGGWQGDNPSWPDCDTSGIHINPGDHPFHLNTEVEIQAADVVAFRFELCSDEIYSSADGEPVEGWYVDDIVITNDNSTYTNNGSNQGASLQMHPGNHAFPADWQWVTDNYAPHEYTKSAVHSWWVPDTTENHKSWLVSPWIQLPDSAMLVWIDYWQDQFSPGAAIEGYLMDYFYWYVRAESDMRWIELTHDYDRQHDSTHCDWDMRWRRWEDDSLYNGTFFIVPDKLPYGSKIQLAIKFVTDDIVQYTGQQTCGAGSEIHEARGLYIDDVTLWGQECYGQNQNLALIWSCEHDRPLPLSVPAESSWACSLRVWSKEACEPTAVPAPVEASVEPPNAFIAFDTIPAGFPANHDTIFAIGTFTATQATDVVQAFEAGVFLPGDADSSDDSLFPEFYFYVTDSLSEYIGYDDLIMKTGQRSWHPYEGVGVLFYPNFNWGNWKDEGEGYKLLSVQWMSAYAGSTRLRIWPAELEGSKHVRVMWDWIHIPSCWWARIPRQIGIDPWEFLNPLIDTVIHVPHIDWARIDFYDYQGNVPPEMDSLRTGFFVYLSWEGVSQDSVGGVGFDDPRWVLGGHTFLGKNESDSLSFTNYVDYDLEEPFQDAMIRAQVASRRRDLGVGEEELHYLLPQSFFLSQNYPNPFNPGTEIKYALPKDCDVKLTIYNILGQKVTTLLDGNQKAGYKVVRWDARSFSSGIYFYRLKAGGFMQTKRMVVLR